MWGEIMRDGAALLLLLLGAVLVRRRKAAGPEAPPPATPAAGVMSHAPGHIVIDFGRPVPADVTALVSSGWSRPRGAALHRALDIIVPKGTPVLAIDDGTVVRVKDKLGSDAGLWVGVRHPSGILSRSIHLSKPLVQLGQTVRKGDVIGLSGQTGNAAVPHLHLDLRVPQSMLPLIEHAIGKPATGWGPPLGGDGYSIPGEPFVPIDHYRDDVKRDAKRVGVPLYVGPLALT